MTIRTKYYAQCDVCSEEFGPFDDSRDASAACEDWVTLQKNYGVVKAHTIECAKIALDNAEDMFQPHKKFVPKDTGLAGPRHPHDHGFGIGCFPPVKGVFEPLSAPVGPGDYMQRQFGGPGKLLADERGLLSEVESIPARMTPEESQSGKHGEKEK